MITYSVPQPHKTISYRMTNFLLSQSIGKDMINQHQLNIGYMELLIIMVALPEVIIHHTPLIMESGINLMIAMLVKFRLEVLSPVLPIYFSMKEYNEINDIYLGFIF